MHAHLVGSIGLVTVDEVYRTVGEMLEAATTAAFPTAKSVAASYGSAGNIRCCGPAFFCDPIRRARSGRPIASRCSRWPKASRRPMCGFGELGLRAREARASYLDFVAARDSGTLPKGIRFQVCLPTPFAVVSSVVVPAALPAVEAAYEKAMIAEVAALCRHIPHRDLCVQWDVCNEMVVWDGQASDAVPANVPREELIARMQRLCAGVPEDVELGLHLCYGDFGARHFVEPKDAARMVEFANASLVRAIPHASSLHPYASAD